MSKRQLLKYGPLLLLAVAGVPCGNYYVEQSRGMGIGFVDIPRASADGLISELTKLRTSQRAPVLVSDTPIMVLAKIIGVYTKGHQLLTLSKDYVGDTLQINGGARNTTQRSFNLKDDNPARQTNDFKEDLRVRRAGLTPADVELLASPATQTILNRRPQTLSTKPLIVRRWSEVKNHLVLIESERGLSYFGRNRLLAAIFPLEPDQFFPGSTFSSLGRDILFQVIHPSNKIRILVGLTTMNRTGKLRELPPTAVIGDVRAPLPVVGSGSARVVSPPVTPQFIGGEPFIGLDMGREGAVLEEKRTGLMRLYNIKLPLDWRRCVAMAREISAISEEDYQRMRPPHLINRFPEGLGDPALEYSGIYEDGWVEKQSYVTFLRPANFVPLVIRGMIPQVGTAKFTNVIRVRVNGKEIARRPVGTGEFELRLNPPPGSQRNSINIEFEKAQKFQDDDRSLSALLRCVGFAANSCDGAAAEGGANIFASDESIFQGNGWYTRETSQNKDFHWGTSGAEVFAGPAASGKVLNLDMEPGPAQAGHPLRLEVRDERNITLSSSDLVARSRVSVTLPDNLPPGQGGYTLRLFATDASKPNGSDPRTLDFRIFRASLQAATVPQVAVSQDIASAAEGIAVGEKWNALETYKGERFRWVDNDATFRISEPKVFPDGLAIELEPGPGITTLPMVLRIFDSTGRQVQAYEVTGRDKLVFPLPARTRKDSTFRLRVDNGGKKIAADPRVLNFRVFRIKSNSQVAEVVPDIAHDPSITIGEGWYPIERYQNDTFRWANNDAKFAVRTEGIKRVAIDVAPGPGLGGKPLLLKIFDSTGHQVQATQVKSRQIVNFYPPRNTKSGTFLLHADGGGKPATGDPRILNFRVFSITPGQ
jgi:hypothetical protein